MGIKTRWMNTMLSCYEKVQSSFIPSCSPVFGGLWESRAKIALHIKRVVGNASLTYKEFNTIITKIEGTLNSRRIAALSSDPSDLSFLSPGHFLIGAFMTSHPELDFTPIPDHKKKVLEIV